jgi:hypothetical protein
MSGAFVEDGSTAKVLERLSGETELGDDLKRNK